MYALNIFVVNRLLFIFDRTRVDKKDGKQDKNRGAMNMSTLIQNTNRK